MSEEKQSTVLERVLDGFMEERGIKDAEELAAAMRAETGESFDEDDVRYSLDQPQDADAVFLYALVVTLKLDEDEVSAMTEALRVDVEAYLKTTTPV